MRVIRVAQTLARRTPVLPIRVPPILAQDIIPVGQIPVLQRRAVPAPAQQIRAAPTIHAGSGTLARLRPVAPDTPLHLVRR